MVPRQNTEWLHTCKSSIICTILDYKITHKVLFKIVPAYSVMFNQRKWIFHTHYKKIFCKYPQPTIPIQREVYMTHCVLCSTCTCFVMLLMGPEICVCVLLCVCVCVCVCILATQRATLAGLFWHSIYRCVIWGLSFSLRPKVFVSLCDKN